MYDIIITLYWAGKPSSIHIDSEESLIRTQSDGPDVPVKWEGLLTALCRHDACCRLRHMHCPTHVTWSEPMHHWMSAHHKNKIPSSEDFAERFGISTRFAPTGAFCSNIEKGILEPRCSQEHFYSTGPFENLTH